MSLLTSRNQLVRSRDALTKAIDEIDEFLGTIGVSVDNPAPGQIAKKHRGRKPGSKNKPKVPVDGAPAPETPTEAAAPEQPQAAAS